jgi:hypothetical protein
MKRIHIVGSGPRTGTTLLAEAMATCFHIDHACKHEASICTKEPRTGNCLLTKQPVELNAVRLPLLLNNDLYVICIIRDPRDSIVSFHGSKPGVYWTSLRFWKQFCKKYNTLSKNQRFILLKYEDLVRYPDKIQNYLQIQIPFLQKKYAFSEYHRVAKPSDSSFKALKGLRPIEPVGIGNWKNHLSRVKQQIMIHGPISDELIRFGYETDDEWEKTLLGVKEGSFPTKIGEHFTLNLLFKRKRKGIQECFNILLRTLVRKWSRHPGQ